MPFEIGKLSRGLSAALNLKERGRTPGVLADQLVETFEGRDLFLLDSREFTGFFTNAAPANGFNFYTSRMAVPPGELWYVWHYIVVATTGAGVTVDLCPAINLDGVGAGAVIGDYAAAAASQSIRLGNMTPFWAGPGSDFGFVVRSLVGAPSIQGGAVITRLKV